MANVQKVYAAWIAAAEDQGWRVRSSRNGHVIYPPSGERPIAVHSRHGKNPGPRVLINQAAQLKRAGLEL